MHATLPRDAAPLRGEPSTEDTDTTDAMDRSVEPQPVARDTSDRSVETRGPSAQAAHTAKQLRYAVGRFIRGAGKHLATLGIALLAVLIAAATWQHYVTAPWTRNGSVRVQVANVAPQVAGKIVELRVADNQFVHKGDVLYVIDPFDFEVAVRIGKALVDQRAADLVVKQAEFDRRQHLSDLATTPEEQQIFAGNAAQAKAAYEAAAHQLAQAELNLKRTSVVSPVDGYVTNLLLRAGDYAVTGVSNVSVIDSNSFWIRRHTGPAQRGPDLHLGAPRAARAGSSRHRHRATRCAARLRHDSDGDHPTALRWRGPNLARPVPREFRRSPLRSVRRGPPASSGLPAGDVAAAPRGGSASLCARACGSASREGRTRLDSWPRRLATPALIRARADAASSGTRRALSKLSGGHPPSTRKGCVSPAAQGPVVNHAK